MKLHLCHLLQRNEQVDSSCPYDDVEPLLRGLDCVQDWAESLSGGERQRLSFVRLFFHCPVFALLDESTSAINEDASDAIFSLCAQLGITLVSVSHREFIRKYHNMELRLVGNGSYTVTEIVN